MSKSFQLVMFKVLIQFIFSLAVTMFAYERTISFAAASVIVVVFCIIVNLVFPKAVRS